MKQYSLSALLLIVGAFLGFLAGSFLAGEKAAQKSYNNVLFTTVLSADENSSVEEKETASQFLAEAVIGWTLSPAFTSSLDFSIAGKKQERGNLVFQFDSASKEEGLTRSAAIKGRLLEKLEAYNAAARTSFGMLFEPVQTTEKQFKSFSWGVLGAMLGFFIVLVGLELFRMRRFFV